uniref:Uncharacterized protein n=1 Tax=Anguilla anguilla TaxID=7936 RepID=A0A0E9WZB1_ANGAN
MRANSSSCDRMARPRPTPHILIGAQWCLLDPGCRGQDLFLERSYSQQSVQRSLLIQLLLQFHRIMCNIETGKFRT